MKRWLLSALAVFLLAAPSAVFAAGSVTYSGPTKITVGTDLVEKHTWSWTADAADGSVPATASDAAITGYIILGVTDPGATAPTALYDITMVDSDNIDAFGTTLTNRSATLSEQTRPGLAGATDFGERFVNSVLTMNLTNNSVNSATGVVVVYVRRPR